MKNLGIYEVAPEDFALCNLFAPQKSMYKYCREGLDLVYKECM